jgi:tRNA dimethylallyltransferase
VSGQKTNLTTVVFILGPTASGKTKLAIDAALELGGEIINADSIQVYKSLDIGSAKPTTEELNQVPHHLIGHMNEGESYAAGKFRNDVLETIKDRSKAGVKNFYIVGGSGFYIKALLHGLYQIPEIPAEIQEQILKEDIKDLYEELKKVDPEAALKINPNDSYRIARAVEVFRATQIPFSDFKNKFSADPFPYRYVRIGLKADKEILRERVARRADTMLKTGIIEEVKSLKTKGFETWDALSSVGYKEVLMYLNGTLPEDQLKDEIVKNTMGLIKRQMTWFKKDEDITWFDVSTANEKIVHFIKEQM